MLEDFLGQLLEQYKENLNNDEKTGTLYRKLMNEEKAFIQVLSEKEPELIQQCEEYFGTMAEYHDMEVKSMYQQGARDIVKLLKQVGVL